MPMPRSGVLAVLAIALLHSVEAFSCGSSLSAGITRSVTNPPPFSRGASQLPLVARRRPAAAQGVRTARSMALSDAGAQLRSLAAEGGRDAVSVGPLLAAVMRSPDQPDPSPPSVFGELTRRSPPPDPRGRGRASGSSWDGDFSHCDRRPVVICCRQLRSCSLRRRARGRFGEGAGAGSCACPTI